jgi:hypothetical protein
MWRRVDLVWTDISEECIAQSEATCSCWFLARSSVCSHLLTLVPHLRLSLQPPTHAGSLLAAQSAATCSHWFLTRGSVCSHLLTLVPCSQLSLQPPAHAGSSLADFSSLKMEAIHSSKTSVHIRSTQSHFPEEAILLMKEVFTETQNNLAAVITSVSITCLQPPDASVNRPYKTLFANFTVSRQQETDLKWCQLAK